MAFRPVNNEEGKKLLIPAKASIAFVKGNALKDDGAGFITNAASGDNTDVFFIADEEITSNGTDGVTLLNCTLVKGVLLEADTSNTPAQTDVGTDVDLSAAGTVDTTAATDQVFHVVKVVLPLSAKKVIGYFNQGVPNS